MAAAKESTEPPPSKSVEREMKAMKAGKLKSGSGEKVTNPKQAIAIGLSEARKAGGKVPPPPAAKKTSAKKPAGKTTASKSSGKEIRRKGDRQSSFRLTIPPVPHRMVR